MGFAVERFDRLEHRLDTSDIDFADFAQHPLAEPVLRTLRYMHDVEHHTICYLRDLLVTRAHRDPEIVAFLTIWSYEEHWHGEAIGKVLEAHGELANADRIAPLRDRLGFRDHLRPLISQVGSLLSRHAIALYMSWGAVNEWTTQAGYSRLIQRANHPVLTELLGRIMRQEGSHISFYMAQAQQRLEGNKKVQFLVRKALSALWAPVGSGIMPRDEVSFLISYLFADAEGLVGVDRIDRRIAALPGLSGMSLVRKVVEDLSTAA